MKTKETNLLGCMWTCMTPNLVPKNQELNIMGAEQSGSGGPNGFRGQNRPDATIAPTHKAQDTGDNTSSNPPTPAGVLCGNYVRLFGSAHSKFHATRGIPTEKTNIPSKKNVEFFCKSPNPNDSVHNDEVIPAVIYEPCKDLNEESFEASDSSVDYVNQVNKALGDEAESSKKRDECWLSRCVQLEQPEMMQNILARKVVVNQASVKLSVLSGDEPTLMDANDEKETEKTGREINLAELVNPCDDMRNKREDRRASKRLQQHLVMSVGPAQVADSKKRNMEGNISSS